MARTVKKPSLKILKKRLDDAFSVFIRQRGMDAQGFNRCVSCGALLPWKSLQCGHYFRRQHLGTRWDPRNCAPQCFSCNVWRRGNYGNFARWMFQTYSTEVMDELYRLHQATVKLTREDLEEMIVRYS